MELKEPFEEHDIVNVILSIGGDFDPSLDPFEKFESCIPPAKKKKTKAASVSSLITYNTLAGYNSFSRL